jgi:hypothetical protein
MIFVYERCQGLLHSVQQMVVPLFLPNVMSVQEGFLFQNEVLLVLCPMEKTFQYQENIQLVLKKRLVLAIFLYYLCLFQMRFPIFPKPRLFLPHSSSKIVLLDALLPVGILPDHSFVRCVLLSQFLEHSPMEIVL